jgi:hypothetical protein
MQNDMGAVKKRKNREGLLFVSTTLSLPSFLVVNCCNLYNSVTNKSVFFHKLKPLKLQWASGLLSYFETGFEGIAAKIRFERRCR